MDLFEEINPSIDAGCDNLVPGLAYCVLPTANWNSTSGNGTLTTQPAPTATPPGTTDSCYEWHVVIDGDYCALIESEYDITMDQLQLWNPDLWANCSNLDLGEAYCVDGGLQATVTPTAKAKRSTPARLYDNRAVETGSQQGGLPVGWPYPLPSAWGTKGLSGN